MFRVIDSPNRAASGQASAPCTSYISQKGNCTVVTARLLSVFVYGLQPIDLTHAGFAVPKSQRTIVFVLGGPGSGKGTQVQASCCNVHDCLCH